jgi:hypothetical protein
MIKEYGTIACDISTFMLAIISDIQLVIFLVRRLLFFIPFSVVFFVLLSRYQRAFKPEKRGKTNISLSRQIKPPTENSPAMKRKVILKKKARTTNHLFILLKYDARGRIRCEGAQRHPLKPVEALRVSFNSVISLIIFTRRRLGKIHEIGMHLR